LVVSEDDEGALLSYLRDRGASVAVIDVADPSTSREGVIRQAVGASATSPAGGSPSIEDASRSVQFPRFVIVRGLESLVAADEHLALAVALGLHRLSKAFARTLLQFEPVFVLSAPLPAHAEGSW
jgi:hypothetical protein